jgi:hypothetical protein
MLINRGHYVVITAAVIGDTKWLGSFIFQNRFFFHLYDQGYVRSRKNIHIQISARRKKVLLNFHIKSLFVCIQ